MEVDHLETVLGIIAALFVATLVLVFSTLFPSQQNAPRPPSTASSTLSVVSGFSFPPLVFSNFNSLTSTTSVATEVSIGSTTPEKIVVGPAKPKAVKSPARMPIADTETPPPPPTPESILLPSSVALRNALVNIICYVRQGNGLNSISGSGVIIDPKGFILTNAHVAQFFLLTDRGVSCVIRSGSPAVTAYEAKLAFISPAWLHANATVLTQSAPVGTGEYDFALLAITKTRDLSSLTVSFPYVPLAREAPTSRIPVSIGSYGAQFLGRYQVETSLYPTIVFSSIKEVFTFATDSIDILALGGSPAAQEGSSGGGVTDMSGNLIGVLTTSTMEDDVMTRSLHAITASYIRAEYANETASTLDILLSESPPAAADNFALKIPNLEPIITSHLR